MTEILLLAILIVLAVMAGFLIPTLLELRRSAKEISSFIDTAETTIKPAVEELNETLKSLHAVIDDVNAVTGDVRKVSSAIGDVADSIKEINGLIEEIPLRVSGVRAGIRAALEVLIAKLFKR